MPFRTLALRRRRLRQHGVQRGDDRHGQPREQRQDVAAGLAAEDAEFVLQRDDVELPGVQEVGGAPVILDPLAVVDLQPHGGG